MNDVISPGPEKQDQVPSQPQQQPQQPEAPKTNAEKAEAQPKAPVIAETKAELSALTEGLGGKNLIVELKKFVEALEEFFKKFKVEGGLANFFQELFKTKNPNEAKNLLDNVSDYKVPPVENTQNLQTIIGENPAKAKLVNYMYDCLKITQPTKEQLEPHEELKLEHLMVQLSTSLPSEKGSINIMKGFENPPKFYINDPVFFLESDGTTTGGFVKEINNGKMKIATLDTTGAPQILEKETSKCLFAFHVPGNKVYGPVPVTNSGDKDKIDS